VPIIRAALTVNRKWEAETQDELASEPNFEPHHTSHPCTCSITYIEMSSKPAVISVIGSLNVDLVTRTPRVPVAGETLTSESFNIGWGGKGANQAVACARLSRTQEQASSKAASDVEVRMVGAVGDDEFHGGFLKALQADGLKTDNIEILEGKKTGVAVITVETSTGENRIMFCPGANYDVEEKDLVDADASVALFQLELPLNVVCVEPCYEARETQLTRYRSCTT
jgi:ribokinase